LNKNEKHHEAKLGLIKKIATKGMSISDLLKRIAEIKGKPVLLKVEATEVEIPSSDAISSMTHEQVSGYKQNSEQKVKDINKQIADLNDKLKKYMEFIDKAEKRLSSSLDKAA
jgi:predicted translin family RNA/ssDNA-binding protein